MIENVQIVPLLILLDTSYLLPLNIYTEINGGLLPYGKKKKRKSHWIS